MYVDSSVIASLLVLGGIFAITVTGIKLLKKAMADSARQAGQE